MRAGWEAAAAVALLASGCGLGRELVAVDSIEEGRALLVVESGEAVTRRVAELPPGVREGDVFVEGRADEEARQRLLFEVRDRRERLLRRSGPPQQTVTLEEP